VTAWYFCFNLQTPPATQIRNRDSRWKTRADASLRLSRAVAQPYTRITQYYLFIESDRRVVQFVIAPVFESVPRDRPWVPVYSIVSVGTRSFRRSESFYARSRIRPFGSCDLAFRRPTRARGRKRTQEPSLILGCDARVSSRRFLSISGSRAGIYHLFRYFIGHRSPPNTVLELDRDRTRDIFCIFEHGLSLASARRLRRVFHAWFPARRSRSFTLSYIASDLSLKS